MARITISGVVWGASRRAVGEEDVIPAGNAMEARAAEAAPPDPMGAPEPAMSEPAMSEPAPDTAEPVMADTEAEAVDAIALEPMAPITEPLAAVELAAIEPAAALDPELAATELAATELAATELAAIELAAIELAAIEPAAALDPELAAIEVATSEAEAVEAAVPEPLAVEPLAVEPLAVEPLAAITEPVTMLDPEPATSEPTSLEPAALDPERQAQARRYARQRQALMLVNLGIGAAVVAVLLFTGLSFALRDALTYALGGAAGWVLLVGWQPLLVGAYFGVIFLALLVIDLPLSYYGGFVLPRRYGLSTQTLRGWVSDLAKGQALSLVFELVAVQALYLLLAAAPLSWWLWAGVAVLFVTVILANLAPILLLPLFYKLTPLPEGDVRSRTLALAARAKTRVRGVFSMNLSAKTTAANAAVMGLGNTRRIVIGDTLLDRYTPDEIEVVMAHELGHQVHSDIPKLVAVNTITTLGGLYLANVALHAVVDHSHRYAGLSDVATLPLVGAALGVFGLVILPLVNGFSRYVEHEADVYALDLTGKVDAFIGAMTRLANQNLAELQPSPIVEFLLYDHPSTGRRLAFAREWAERDRAAGGEKPRLEAGPL